jgi:murein DD-endopeptidase MepM/ murein hydrolase activator NlpD
VRVIDRDRRPWPIHDLKLAALVAVASFGAGLASASLAKAGDGEPKLTDVACLSECGAGDAASVGSTVELSGKGLGMVEKVKFTSDAERRVKVEPDDVSDETVEATVPEGAVTGPPRVVDSERRKATSPKDLEIAKTGGDSTAGQDPGAQEPSAPSEPGAGDPSGVTSPDGLSVDPDKGFFKGKRRATAHFSVADGGSAELQVVSVDDGSTVATLAADEAAPGGEASVSWNGVTDDGEVAPNGEYEFRAASGGDSAAFEQYDHIFPVNGKHDYGDGLGAGRNHQGQDVFADCGTKLVAARAGKVEFNQVHDAAGNYLVIDGKKTDTDYAYMHLEAPSDLTEGEKVKTGEAIGRVGETGNASGCHLHFEMWDRGYQQGGPADPAPELKRWDRWS